jgi:amidase
VREVDIPFGGDDGGSIRLPAAYCGVPGLASLFGAGFSFEQSVDHVAPMARTPEETAAAL